jgi:hypothetical protein
MIQAKDVRVGNLVEYRIVDKMDERKEWWEVCEIDSDDIGWLSNNGINDKDFRPIPLTEELLLRLGFEKGNMCYKNAFSLTVQKTDFYIRPSHTGYYWGFNEDKNKMDCELNDVLSIDYLHDLQNLIYSLTKTELTLKP